MGLLPEIRELGNAQRQALPSRGRRGIVNEEGDEALNVAVRNRRDQNAVDHAEDDARRTDSQRQSDDGNGRESLILPQRSRAVSDVLPDPSECLHA